MLDPDWHVLLMRAIDVEMMFRVLLAFILGGLKGTVRDPGRVAAQIVAVFTTLCSFVALRWGPAGQSRRALDRAGRGRGEHRRLKACRNCR